MHYPVNKNYSINKTLFRQLSGHMEAIRERYSDIIPLRMDFAYKKTSGRFQQRWKDHLDMDMYRLGEKMLSSGVVIGYAWVMEFTYNHGLHFHAVFYLNGQKKRNSYSSARYIADEWREITSGDGIFDNCQSKKYHRVNGRRNIHHLDHEGYKNLAFILSYLAKEEQKDTLDEHVCWLSDIPERSRRGRPRHRNREK